MHMHPDIARLTAVETHVVGHRPSRIHSCAKRCRSRNLSALAPFIIRAFYNGIKQKPGATFGNVKANVMADEDDFAQGNFYSVIRNSD